MSQRIEQFFASVPARASTILRGPVVGAIQIDLTRGNETTHWFVRMKPCTAEVSRSRGPAEATWNSSEELFERLITGHTQAIAALLRNESTFTGNVVLFLAFRLFFPDQPGAHHPREVAGEQTGGVR